MSEPACAKCGSKRLHRARTRSEWQRFLRRNTPYRRYSCGECGHRGWRWGSLPRSEHPEELSRRSTGSRPIEQRDHRLQRRNRMRVLVTILVALLLGVVVAKQMAGCETFAPLVAE